MTTKGGSGVTEKEKNEVVERELKMVWQICVTRLCGYEVSSIEDVCQEVFMRWLDSGKEFDSPEHEKAWFIRTTLNCCTDVFRAAKKAPLPLDECEYLIGSGSADERLAASEIIKEILSLPEAERDAAYLSFVEGYSADEIAKLLGKLPQTIRKRLSRAREKLRIVLKGDQNG